MTIDEIKKELLEAHEDYTIVKIEDYENKEHYSYKSLYFDLKEKYEQDKLAEDAAGFDAYSRIQQLEKALTESETARQLLESQNTGLRDAAMKEFQVFMKKIIEEDIIVSDVKVFNLDRDEIVMNSENRTVKKDDLAFEPGVYGFKRPSFFTPLQKELNKENEAKKVTSNTKNGFIENLKFWKKASEQKKLNKEEVAVTYDKRRQDEIIKICNENYSNEERYLKYLLITPGLNEDYLGTLMGAAEIGIDARVVISLLEQPKESFNKEMIESYVSMAHKGTEYNHRKELAEELVAGNWFVTANLNGRRERWQLVPYKLLKNIEESLKKVEAALMGKSQSESESAKQLEEKEVAPVPEENADMESHNMGIEIDMPEPEDMMEEFSDSDIMDGLGEGEEI